MRASCGGPSSTPAAAGGVERDDVAAREQVVEREQWHRVGGGVRVVRDDGHADRGREGRQRPADAPEADDAERRVGEPQRHARRRVVPGPGADGGVEARQAAQPGERAGQGVLGDLLRAVRRRVGHDEPAVAQPRHVQVVGADRARQDEPQVRIGRDLGGSDRRRAGDDRDDVARLVRRDVGAAVDLAGERLREGLHREAAVDEQRDHGEDRGSASRIARRQSLTSSGRWPNAEPCPSPSSRWKWPSARQLARPRGTRRGGVCTSSENATAWTGASIAGQQVGRVEVQARLPLRREHRAVARGEVALHERLDALPDLVVAERGGGVVLHRVVGGREGGRQLAAVATQGDLRLLPLADEARLAHARAHDDGRPDEVGAVVRELDRDERAHRQADEERGPVADGLDEGCGVRCVHRDVPRRLGLRDGRARAARVVGRVAVARLERGRLVAAPVRAGVVAGGQPEDVGAGARLLVPQRDVVEDELRHGRATRRGRRGAPSSSAGVAVPSVGGGSARSRSGSTCSATFAATTSAQSSAPGSPAASSGPAARRRPSRSAISTAVRRRAGNASVSDGSMTTRVRSMSPGSPHGPRTSATVKSPRGDSGRDRPDEVVLRLLGGRREDLRERVGGGERRDRDRLDVVRRESLAPARLERRADRALRPAAAGVRLEVELLEPPGAAEVARVLVEEGRVDRREAAGGHERGAHADGRAPGARVLRHGRLRDRAHDVRDRRVVLGEADRVVDRGRVQAEQPRRRPRRRRGRPRRRWRGSRRRGRAARRPRGSRSRSRRRPRPAAPRRSRPRAARRRAPRG